MKFCVWTDGLTDGHSKENWKLKILLQVQYSNRAKNELIKFIFKSRNEEVPAGKQGATKFPRERVIDLTNER